MLVANCVLQAMLLLSGYNMLYGLQGRLYESELNNLLADARNAFGGNDEERWSEGEQALKSHWDVETEFYQVDDEGLEPYVITGLDEPPDSSAYVDHEVGTVYLRLNDRYLVVVDLMASPLWLSYLAEITAFILHLILSVGLVLAFGTAAARSERQLRNAVTPVVDGDADATPAELIQRMAARLETLETRHAEQLSSHKDLLHGVAHELRSPLARMRFALELEEFAQDTAGREMQDTVSRNIDELDAMIAELLTFARLQHSGEHHLDDEFSLGDCTSEAMASVASVYPEIEFLALKDLSSTRISANRAQTVRALTNLLRNAGRYGRRVCQVSFETDDDYVSFHVDDDGDGIAPGKRERIFEPFTRLDPSRSRDSGGAGLGLAIVASVAKLHGGDVSVGESPLGGARVTLRLARHLPGED